MIRDLIKWVVPGLATVLAGTTLCVAMTSADMAGDLTAKSAAAMTAAGYDWAELSLDARDLTLSGTTTSEVALQAAINRLDSIAGIRSIASDVTLAPLASPYLFTASIATDGPALLGAVPDEITKQRLLDRAGLEVASLELRSGMPERGGWTAGAQFAIDNLKYLDQGEISIADTTLNLTGRAKSERDYRDLLIVMRAGPPASLELGSVQIIPPLVEPYRWNASFDGKRIEVTGFVPDDAMAERLRMADVSGLPVATGLTLGSGEPVGFAVLSQTLLEQLAKLDYGSASINGDESTLTGAPPSVDVAQAVTDTLQSAGSIVVLEPPRIPDYWMSATLQAGGVIVFDGYAPDETTREAFAQHEGADTSYLKLGRGAPERYQSATDFGLAALDLMSEGRFALRDNILTISGIAASAGDYDALQASLADGAPQGLVLARAEIQAPRADPEPETAALQEVEQPPVAPAPEPEPVAPSVAEPEVAVAAAPVEAIVEPAPLDADVSEETAAPEPEAPPAPASEPEAAKAAPAAPPAPSGPPACAAPVAQFSARNAIFFQSGAANIARESEAALDELAIDLAACPTATVHVEGHTDADGDEGLNMALSVARAEAVVNALVLRGVAADRLYAVGYGETAPIADNTTAQGKRINRRIVVTVKAGD